MGTFFILCFILCKLVICRCEDFNLNEKEKEDVKCVVEKLYQSNKDLFEKLADFIIKQGDTSNNINLNTKDERNNSNAGSEITDILSNMTNNQLINLLHRSPNKEEFTAQDLIAALHDESNVDDKQVPSQGNITKLLPTFNSKHIIHSNNKTVERSSHGPNESLDANDQFKNTYDLLNAIPKVNTSKITNTTHKPISHDEILKVFKILNQKPRVSHSSQVSNEDIAEMSDEKHNKLVDDLLTKLRNVCHHSKHQNAKRKKKVKRIVLTVDEDIDSAEFVKLFKKRVNKKEDDVKTDREGENQLLDVLKQLSNSQEKQGWQMFLILNEDVDTNAAEGIISVDPESLSENSTVLPLGILHQNISQKEMSQMMQKLTFELKQDSRQKVLKHLANGDIKLNTTNPFRTLIRRSYARKFIKPELCNYQYRWTKLDSTIKWIICAGNIIVPEVNHEPSV